MTYLVEIPSRLQTLVALGKAYIPAGGVNVHDFATGRILGQLQQTGRFAGQLGSAAATGHPILAGATLASSLAANIQSEVLRRKLNVVIDLLENVQTITAIGAVASVVNIGVSVAGFAVVLDRIQGLERQTDALSAKLDEARAYPYKVRALTALRRCEEAFGAPRERQRHMWQDAEASLDEAFQHFLITATGVSLDSPAAAGRATAERLFFDGRFTMAEANALIDWLLAVSRARLEALLLLGDPGSAERVAYLLGQWLSQIDLDPKTLVSHKAGKAVISSSTRGRLLEEAQQTALRITHAKDGLRALGDGMKALSERGVDTEQLVKEARSHPEPDVLYLPLDELPEGD